MNEKDVGMSESAAITNSAAAAAGGADTSHGGHVAGELHVHVMPVSVLAAVWLLLMVFTAITVAVTLVDLGATANLWVALVIATVKASLVALYFMHLRYDNPFNGIVLVCALLFVMLFIGIAMLDSEAYHPTLIPGYAPELHK